MATQVARIAISQEMLLQYIQATVLGGIGKGEAYKAIVDPIAKNPSQSAQQLERRNDFHEMRQTVVDMDEIAMKKTVLRMKSKYAQMVERNIEVATELLDVADNSKDKASAVRLVNESIGAMAVIGGVSQPQPPGKIDKSGVVI